MGSVEETTYVVHPEIMECKYVDHCNPIIHLGSLALVDNLVNSGYNYKNDVDELFRLYPEDIP